MRNIQEELIKELQALNTKREALGKAIDDEELDISTNHRDLMRKQLRAMDHYAHTIRMRIDDLR